MGHAWLIVPSDWNVPEGIQPMTVRCERCDIERRDQLSKYSGELFARKYAYPEGYLFSKDNDEVELPTRIDFRLSWIESEIAKQRDARNESRQVIRSAGHPSIANNPPESDPQ